MTQKFTRWDPVDHLKSDEDMALYLDACLDEDPGDGTVVRAALNDIARAQGMTELARATGITREGLYKALSPAGNPEFSTILKVIKALRIKLHAAPERVQRNRLGVSVTFLSSLVVEAHIGVKYNQLSIRSVAEHGLPLFSPLCRSPVRARCQRLCRCGPYGRCSRWWCCRQSPTGRHSLSDFHGAPAPGPFGGDGCAEAHGHQAGRKREDRLR